MRCQRCESARGVPLLFRDAIKVEPSAEEQLPADDGGPRTEAVLEPLYGQHLGRLVAVAHDMGNAVAAGDVDSAGDQHLGFADNPLSTSLGVWATVFG